MGFQKTAEISLFCPRTVRGQTLIMLRTLPRGVHRRYDSALKCLAERDTQTEPDTCSDRHINPIRGVRVDLGRPQSNYYQDTCAMIHPERTKRVPRVMRYDALRFTCASLYPLGYDPRLSEVTTSIPEPIVLPLFNNGDLVISLFYKIRSHTS